MHEVGCRRWVATYRLFLRRTGAGRCTAPSENRPEDDSEQPEAAETETEARIPTEVHSPDSAAHRHGREGETEKQPQETPLSF